MTVAVLMLLITSSLPGVARSEKQNFSSVYLRDAARVQRQSLAIRDLVREYYTYTGQDDWRLYKIGQQLFEYDSTNPIFIRMYATAAYKKGRRVMAKSLFQSARSLDRTGESELAFAQLVELDTAAWSQPWWKNDASEFRPFLIAAKRALAWSIREGLVHKDPGFLRAVAFTSLLVGDRKGLSSSLAELDTAFGHYTMDSPEGRLLSVQCALMLDEQDRAQALMREALEQFPSASILVSLNELVWSHHVDPAWPEFVPRPVTSNEHVTSFSLAFSVLITSALSLIAAALILLLTLGTSKGLRRYFLSQMPFEQSTVRDVPPLIRSAFLLVSAIGVWTTLFIVRLLSSIGLVAITFIGLVYAYRLATADNFSIADLFLIGLYVFLFLKWGMPTFSGGNTEPFGIAITDEIAPDLISKVKRIAREVDLEIDEVRLVSVGDPLVYRARTIDQDGRARRITVMAVAGDDINFLTMSEFTASVRIACHVYALEHRGIGSAIGAFYDYANTLFSRIRKADQRGRKNIGLRLAYDVLHLWVPVVTTWDDLIWLTAVSDTTRALGRSPVTNSLILRTRRHLEATRYFSYEHFISVRGSNADAWKDDHQWTTHCYEWFRGIGGVNVDVGEDLQLVRRLWARRKDSFVSINRTLRYVVHADEWTGTPDNSEMRQLIVDHANWAMLSTIQELGYSPTSVEVSIDTEERLMDVEYAFG